MLSESDIIGLFEVDEGGVFKAKLKPIEMYKGSIKHRDIWYTGFSDKYGPLDSLEAGQQFVLFLQKPEKRKDRYNSSSNFADDEITEQSIKDYEFVREQPNGFYAWTPTSGDILVQGDKAYYDLNVTTTSYNNYNEESPPNSSSEFVEFLKAINGKSGRRRFIDTITFRLSEHYDSSPKDRMIAQYLRMLELAGNKEFLDVFNEIAQFDNLEAQFSLARQLGSLKGKNKYELVKKLLKSNYTMVRTEVVKQIPKNQPDLYGELLLKQLMVASDSANVPSLMNPVTNQAESEVIAIVSKLSSMKYKQAAQALISVLQTTENDELFESTVRALDNLGYQDYQKVFLDRISSPGRLSMYNLGNLAVDMELFSAKKPLIQFISNFEKTASSSDSRFEVQMAISALEELGIDDEVEDFMINQMSLLTSNIDRKTSRWMEAILKEYIQSLSLSKSKKAQSAIHESLFFWFGYDMTFTNQYLIKLKDDLEVMQNRKIDGLLKNPEGRKTKTHCFIKNRFQIAKDSSISPDVEFIYLIQVINNKLDHNKLRKVVEQERILISESLDIKKEKIGFGSGGSRYYTDNRFFTQTSSSMIPKYFMYAEVIGDENDLNLLKVIQQNLLNPADSYILEQLSKAKSAIELRLRSNKR